MKTIIAGSRDFSDYDTLCAGMRDFGVVPTVVLCGGARGADLLGERWAKENGIPIEYYPPDYSTGNGKAAPLIRNKLMAINAQALVAFWDGKSRGTAHMIREAKARALKVHVHFV